MFAYDAQCYSEVLKPGKSYLKQHGLIKDKEPVTVIFPGLYFYKKNGETKSWDWVKAAPPFVFRTVSPDYA